MSLNSGLSENLVFVRKFLSQKAKIDTKNSNVGKI